MLLCFVRCPFLRWLQLMTYVHEPLIDNLLPPYDKEFDRICNRITKSYPNSCITFIEKIECEFSKGAYNNKKLTLDSLKVPYKVVELFHGTKSHCLGGIICDGFKVSENKVSAYGKGTYFGVEASTAFNYMHSSHDMNYMFICDVLFTHTRLRDTPCTTLGSVVVDNLEKPKLYSVPEDDSINIKYLVAFYKHAKFT